MQRIAELHEVIDELQADARRITAASSIRGTATSGSRENKSNSTAAAAVDVQAEKDTSSLGEPLCISFEGVDIVSPGGECFATDLSFSVPQGAGMMVTGRSAIGKTSLVRVLSGASVASLLFRHRTAGIHVWVMIYSSGGQRRACACVSTLFSLDRAVANAQGARVPSDRWPSWPTSTT